MAANLTVSAEQLAADIATGGDRRVIEVAGDQVIAVLGAVVRPTIG